MEGGFGHGGWGSWRLLAVVGGGFYDVPVVWGVRGAVVNGSDFFKG